MIGKEYPQIEIIREAQYKRDYCIMPVDQSVKDNLTCLMILEEQFSEAFSAGVILAHTLLWNQLPDYYKSELADLTAIYS